MLDTNEPQDVRITQDLRDKLRDFADVTFSITTDAPDERLTPAIRDIWEALWYVGAADPPRPMGDRDTATPSYVSDPVSISPGTWKVTVDFGWVGEQRDTAPDVIAAVLRRHGATPAVLDVSHLTKEEYDFMKEMEGTDPTDPASLQPRLFRR